MRILNNTIDLKAQIYSVIKKLDFFLKKARLLIGFIKRINRKCYICFLILVVPLESFSETKEYLNFYRGIYTRITPIHEMLEYLGAPNAILGIRDDIFYIYDGIEIAALKSTGRVDSVAVFDKSYIDPNGLSIGSSIPDLVQALEEKDPVMPRDNVSIYFDSITGIYYLFDEARLVERILLVGRQHSTFNRRTN